MGTAGSNMAWGVVLHGCSLHPWSITHAKSLSGMWQGRIVQVPDTEEQKLFGLFVLPCSPFQWTLCKCGTINAATWQPLSICFPFHQHPVHNFKVQIFKTKTTTPTFFFGNWTPDSFQNSKQIHSTKQEAAVLFVPFSAEDSSHQQETSFDLSCFSWWTHSFGIIQP